MSLMPKGSNMLKYSVSRPFGWCPHCDMSLLVHTGLIFGEDAIPAVVKPEGISPRKSYITERSPSDGASCASLY